MDSSFYADGGFLASMKPDWLQREFIVLIGIFNWVGLQKNSGKAVGMVCQPCRTVGCHSEEAYMICMIGEGLTYKARMQNRVRCPE